MDERHIMAVDLGTSKIALTVAKIEGDNIEITYYNETPSDGIRQSRVNNPAKAAEAIKQAVTAAEDELSITCRQVVVGLPKYEVRQENKSFSKERSEEDCVTEEDLEDLKRGVLESFELKDDKAEMLFGAVAQSFNDGASFQIVEDDIIGMTMKRLEGNFKVFIGQAKAVNDIDVAFKRAGDICVSRKFFTPDAIAKAVLYDSEMSNGVALIDLGAGVTSVAIYYGNVMRHYAAIPFGGKSISTDIKNDCVISEKQAENIKLAYGACIPDRLQNLGEKTLIISGNPAMKVAQVPVKYLSQIITARETEIIEAILYEIQCSGFADHLRSGIVITGGGAGLANVSILIKEISGYDVRVGYPKRMFSGYNDFDMSAAASVGMILMAKAEKGLDCQLKPVAPAVTEEKKTEEEEELQDTVFDQVTEEETDKKKKKKKKGGWKLIFDSITKEQA